MCAAAAIDATVHPSAETRALARQAIFDALDEFADYLGIAPDDAQQIFADAMDTAYSTPAGDKARPRAELRIIRVQRGKLHEVVRETEEALIAAGLVFFRGGVLVQPVFRRERSRLTNQYAVLSVCLRLTAPLLSSTIALHAAAYQAQSRHRRDEWLPIDPPLPAIDTVLARAAASQFPTLTGIVDSPTMRPNGSLLTTTGYDAMTRLWYQPSDDVELPPIAERPTRQDAEAALRLLKDLLSGFPFRDDVDRSVALAAILTVVLRGAFDIAPLFLFLAPESGTGKTFLIRLIATIHPAAPCRRWSGFAPRGDG